MTKTKRIAMAMALERAVNFKLINEVNPVTRQEIDKQINMQKIHNARTRRAEKNILENEKLFASYGGIYTQAEINLLHDLHPCLKNLKVAKADPEALSDTEIAELLEQLDMYARCVQEDNHLMA